VIKKPRERGDHSQSWAAESEKMLIILILLLLLLLIIIIIIIWYKWYTHMPKPVYVEVDVTVLWNQAVQTGRQTEKLCFLRMSK
jgi:cell division protein FtsL